MVKKYETVKYKCSFCGDISHIIKHINQKESFMGWCFNSKCDNTKMHKQILLK